MPLYRITAPNGQTYQIEGPPGASDAEVANAVMAQYPEAGKAPQERTFLGGAKELFKGLAPGAVGLIESAATGASALLPESMEKAAREKIASVASAAKQPFAAAAGYEESIPRKLGEAIGSTAPFLLAGPLGLAGRAAAVGLGVGAGAGEARTRAEAEGATAEQRGTATALGIIPGAAEAFAPFRILARIPEGATASAVQTIKRALLAGGEEAAQEAASGLAQNMIAKGIYKPEQALIEGLGEQAAYGGATGAIVQGLMDLALGRRARGSAPPPAPKAEPGPQVAPEAPKGAQGALFTEEEMGKRVPAPEEEPITQPAPAAPQGEQLDLGLDFQREYADIVKEREALKQQPQTPEVKARLKELNDQLLSLHEQEVASIRAEKQVDAETRGMFPGLAKEPAQQGLFPELDVVRPDTAAPEPVRQLTRQQEEVRRRLETADAQAAADVAQKEQERKGGQYRLPLRNVPEDRNVKRDLKIPARPDEITMEDLENLGLPMRSAKTWLEQNVVGKTPAEIRVLVGNNPDLLLQKGTRAQVLKYLTAPVPEGFKETPSVTTPTKTNLPKPRPQPRGSEPSVGVSNQPASPDVVQPGAGVPTTTGAPATPDGLGLAPAGQPSGKGTKAKGTQPPAVTPTGVRTSDQVQTEIRALQNEQQALLTKAGRMPAVNSKARARWDAIDTEIAQKKAEWDTLDKAERKAKPQNAPATTPAAPSAPAATEAPAKPKAAPKPAPKAAAPKTPQAPSPAVATETVDEEAARKAEAEEFKRQMEETERKAKEARAKADAAKQTSPKPAAAAHPEWAKTAAETKKGAVVYSQGDIALVKYVDPNGKIAYGAVRSTSPYVSADVSYMDPITTRRFSSQELTELKAEKGKDLRAEVDLALKYQDGPFTNAKSNVVAGDNINPRYAAYLRELMQELGLKDVRTFLFTKADVENFPAKYHLHGRYARPYEILAEADTTKGATTLMGPNNTDFFIYIKDGMDVDLSLEIIAHELGHMIQRIAFDTASAKEKQAVLDEYDTWLAANKGKKMADVVPTLRNRRNTELMEREGIPDLTTNKLTIKQQQYWLGFSEWFADNVSRWATTADRPLTITEKFFSKVGQMMRDLVALVSGRKFPPARTVAEFMENMGPGSADLWVQSNTPGGMPSVSPNISDLNENPAFKKWFKDSKVVDENGKPLVVYHGTLANFDTFKLSPEGALGAGIYTTPSAEFAGTYADTSNLSRPDAPKDEINGQKIMPVYVSMQNPLILDNERGDPMIAALVKLGVSQDKAEKIVEKAYDENGYVGKQVMTRAIAQGYDGIMQYKRGELSEIVAFKPTQIKSATGNRGTFSEENPKIDFSVTFSDEQLIDSMGPLSAPEQSRLKQLVKGVQSNSDIGYVTKFRTQVADIAATIEKRLSGKFDGAVRNSLGELNPMGLYRQAQDYTKMLLEYFQTGTLYKDPVTGLWKSGEGKGVRPPAEVYALIDKYGEKNGYSRERATQIASRVLEAVRLDEMRRSNKQDGTTFLIHLKDNEIDQLVRAYKADPDLQEMSKLMDEARKAMVDNMVKVGRLSAEEGKLWREVVGYVPFDRETIEVVATNFNKAKKVSGKGLAQLGKLPELVGSLNRPVGNVFDNYLNTLGWMVGQTLKSDATLLTLRSLEDIGFATFLGRSNQGKANVVGAYVDGEMMYWSVPSKYDVMAFKDLNPPKAGWIRAMGAFSNMLRKTVTVLPPFALKQVTDDVQRAMLTSGVRNPGALVWMSLTNFPKLALAELRGIQHPIVKEFGRLGLTGEYDFEAGKPATSLLKDLGYKKRGVFETLIHRLDGITRASDLAVRKAIYDQTMKESNDMLLAQTRAREFINFRRRGANQFVTDMVTVIPFFNAYIQGMDVLYRSASGKDSSASVDRAQARRMFWSRATTVIMLSSLYALGKDDEDEDYKEMDLRTRDGNWILPGGYKIPVPGEPGAIFKVIPERIVEYMKRQGTPEEQTAWDATRTTLSYMFEQYLGRAMPVPQAIKPVIEAWANKSFLTGKDLEGYHHRAMDPSMRTNEQTTELAKAIAVFSRDEIGVEVSPIMIDNALRGYFGSTAAMFTMVTDSLINPTRVDRPLHKYALLSNYLYDPVGTRRMTEFYEEREKVGKANTTLNELMKTDLDRAEKYAEAHADELALESAVNSTLEQLERTRAYRKYLNSAEGAKDMSKDDREAELKEVKKMELEYVQWVREAKTELRKAQR